MKKRFVLLAASLAALGAVAFAPDAKAWSGPEEDQPGWSCVSDGNRICGPSNTEGKPAGCYDGGVLVADWPCTVVVSSDGSSYVYACTN